VGGERQKHLCKIQPNKLQQIILNELEELIDHKGETVLKNHYRWLKGIPQFNLDHNNLLNTIQEFEKNNSKFHLIGNYFNGVSVSDCIKKAKDLVKDIN